MRKLYVLVAAIVAAACLASPALAADPIKTLTKKVTALEKTVKTLRADLGEAEEQLESAEATLACLGPLYPVARYGTASEGYVYANVQTQAAFVTAALDQPESTSGLTPGTDFMLAMSWDPSCASTPPGQPVQKLRPVTSLETGRVLRRVVW